MTTQPKKHHYIPQLLLKRFATDIRSKGKKRPRVFQIGKGGSSRLMLTTEVAASRYFHGPAENGLEDAVGKVETQFANVLNALDRGEPAAAHADQISRLIWFQAIRTRSLRDTFADAGNALMAGIAEAFTTGKALNPIKERIETDIEKTLSETLKSAQEGKTRQQRRAMARRADKLFSNPKRRETFVSTTKAQIETAAPLIMNQFMSRLQERGGVTKAVEDGHIKALQAIVNGGSIPDTFNAVSWELREFPENCLVIGDCCVFSLTTDGAATPIFGLGGEWAALFCPISSSQALIALQPGYSFILSASEANQASAECSTDYIYSSSNNDDTMRAAPFIGNKAWISEAPEFDEMMESLWSEDSRKA